MSGARLNREDTRDVATRDRKVQWVILIEGAANAMIMLLKCAIGLSTGSMAILSDAVHSLSDLANNCVAWFVVRWSAQPPDDGHPYGHRKFETVAVFLLAMLLTVTAFEVAMRALLREPTEIADSSLAAVGMLAVLLGNIGLAAWEGMWARRLQSDLLTADSRHTFADVATTIVAIVGWQAAANGYVWVDTLASFCVAVLILFLAYGLFRRSLPVLVDQAFVESALIQEVALEVPGVIAVHRARSRSYGLQAEVDLVATVARGLSTIDSHEIATKVEDAIRARFPVEAVTVHIEPDESV